MKFLIIRFSSIGDIVLTSPVIRCLKKQVPTARVHYLTKSSYSPILASNPYIDKIHYMENNNIHSVMEELKMEDFDYVIDLHNNIRSLKVKEILGKKSFTVNKLNLRKWVYTSFKFNILPPVHIVDRYLETLSSFGIKNDGAGLDYFLAESDKVQESDIPTSHQAGYIAIVIGAALNTKKYPLHKLKSLCEMLDHPIMLLGGLEDADEGERIAASDKIKIYNACGKFSLNESADLARRAKLVVTNDTGLMHIATAFRKPVISLWGNTVPAFGMYPYYGENYLKQFHKPGNGAVQSPFEIIETRGLICRPCSKIGYDKCPRGHFKCMENIKPSAILDKINKYVQVHAI